jgi:carboxypeptidase Taq
MDYRGVNMHPSIHESQSRLWENAGRSLGFWKYQYPDCKNISPNKPVNCHQEFYNGINKVEASCIRRKPMKDLPFHVMIRYELEKLLIGGDLQADDIRHGTNNIRNIWV